MAIGFMPTDEDTEARYERLNRILLELYEVLNQLIIGEAPRPPGPPEPRILPRVRPFSDSAAPRLPDLVSGSMCPCPPRRRISSQRSTPSSPSCSAQHHSRTFSDLFHPEVPGSPQSPLDDEVFISTPPISAPPISAPPLRLAQPRQRRRRKRSSSFKDVKKRTKAPMDGSSDSWEDEQTRIETTENSANILEQDTVDSSASSSVEKMVAESSFVCLGRSLWTAVFLVIGWKLLVNKR